MKNLSEIEKHQLVQVQAARSRWVPKWRLNAMKQWGIATALVVVAGVAIAASSSVPFVAPPSETFEPYVLYSDTIVTIEAEGERIEVHNFGRCFVRPFHPAGAPRPNAQFLPEGSVPAVRLPSGAVVLIGIASNGQARLDPCWGMRNQNLMTFDPPPQPLAIAHVGPLRQGSVGSVNLSRMFERRERLFAAWLDDAAEPAEIVGYLDEGLLDNPEAKFQLIDIKVRLLSEEEWGDREITRIEDAVPWIAKYCPAGDARSNDLNRVWQAPVTPIVSATLIPDGPLKERLFALSSGIHMLEIDAVEAVPALDASLTLGALPLHGLEWLGGNRALLDLERVLRNDTFHFYPNSTGNPIFAFQVSVGDAEIVRSPSGDDGPIHYDTDTQSIFVVGWVIRLSASLLCTQTRGDLR